MDKEKIRQQFQNYRQAIRELQEQVESQYYYQDEAYARCERQRRTAENERIDRERQAECDRWYREDELKRAVGDLERAHSYGDEWGIARVTEKLKKLNY